MCRGGGVGGRKSGEWLFSRSLSSIDMRFCEITLSDPDLPAEVREAISLNLILANTIQLLEDIGLESVVEYLEAQVQGEWGRQVSVLLENLKPHLKLGLPHGKRDTLYQKLQEIGVRNHRY